MGKYVVYHKDSHLHIREGDNDLISILKEDHNCEILFTGDAEATNNWLKTKACCKLGGFTGTALYDWRGQQVFFVTGSSKLGTGWLT